MPDYTPDAVNVRVTVRMSCILTLSLRKALTEEALTEAVGQHIGAVPVSDLVDSVAIDAVTLDDGTTLAETIYHLRKSLP